MAYTTPSIGPAGLSVSNYGDIQAYLLAQYQASYTSNAYLGTDSADYQDISAFAAMVTDIHQLAVLVYSQYSIQTAIGAGLDILAKNYGTARKVPSYSTANLTVTGTPGVTITSGQARDTSGFIWYLPSIVTIPNSGSIIVQATCATIGTVSAVAGSISQINTGTAGWTGVTNPQAAILGAAVESDSALRARLAQSAALPSQTMLAGTAARVAAVEGVTLSTVLENPTGATDANGFPAHSVGAIVLGGAPFDVATAIFANRGIGAMTYGTTTVSVTDPDTGAVQSISYFQAGQTPIYVNVTLQPLVNFTNAAAVNVQSALNTYLNGLQIGQKVGTSALEYIAFSQNPNPQNPIFLVESLTLGTSSNPSGTADLTLAFNQVATCQPTNVTVTT